MADSILPTVPVVACPICGGTDFGTLGDRRDGIPVLQCQRCRMGVVAARPLDPLAYYSDAYYSHDQASESGYSEYQLVASHSLAWVSELIHILRADGKVLDVGCADGHLLKLLGPPFELHGIEVNDRFRRQCRRDGIRMLGSDITDRRLLAADAGSFDVITAIAVLEHVADIRTALERIRALLAPEGVLIFEVPLISPTHANSVWFNSSLEHIYYPTVEGLAFLIETVFQLPLVGREVTIRDYGSTFVGLVTPSPGKHAELAQLLSHLLDAPIAALNSRRERSFRFLFELVHAAVPTAENVALLAELEPAQVTKEFLHRIATLWRLDLTRGAAEGNRQLSTLQATLEQERSSTATLQAALDQERSRTAILEVTQQQERSRGAALEAMLQQARSSAAMLEATLEHASSSITALEQSLEQQRSRVQALETSLQQRDRQLAEAERRLIEREATIEMALTSTSWKLTAPVRAVGRFLRRVRQLGGLRLGAVIWQMARLAYWLLPISDRARYKLRGGLLTWLSVPAEAPPEVAAARLRDLVQTLTWRRAASEAALLLRGDLADLRMHRKRLVQHLVNQIPQAAFTASVAEFVVRRQKFWPASQPLVSVVIPCYNYGRFVADAVDSVLAQTFQKFEILVVDGGSSAATLTVLKELNRPKTRVYVREGRHLVGDNRNFGISRARGKYVCCLDADDMIKPTYLEKALFLLETQGYDVVSTSIRCFGNRNETYHVNRFPVLADMLQGNQVTTCAVFRKDLWAEAGGFQDTGIGHDYSYEDWRLWVRFAALGARFANIVDEPLFLYRIHSSQSLSNQDQAVPSMDRQREAVMEFNKDVITDDALRLSEENRRIRIKMQDGTINLRRGWAQAPAHETTILIAMPFLIVGGAERLMSEVAGYLSARGFRIVLVTTEYVYSVYGDSAPWFEKATASIYQLQHCLERNRWQEFIDYLLETRHVSLLWIIGSRVFYELLPEIKAAYPKLKVIDLLFNTIGHTANNRKYAEYFDKILVENQGVATWLIEAGERPDKVLQIPSGVDLEAYRPQPKSTGILEELGIPLDSFIAGYSGRLSEEKYPEAFLEIADRCQGEAQIVFLMTGAGPLADQVQQRIEKLALGDRLRFLGQVDTVIPYMSTYDVLVVPSRYDGRPVAVLESLALGVPVIASRVGALPDLIEDGVNGFLCEPGHIDAFAERIRWLAAHPEEHRRMKAAARSFAEATLDARQMFERYEEAIRGVITPDAARVAQSQKGR